LNAIVIAIAVGPTANVSVLANLGMAVAAAANFPALMLSLFWRRFNTAGAIAGLAAGLLSSISLILAGPAVMGIDAPGSMHHLIHARPWYPLENPGLLGVPIGFAAAVLGTFLSGESASEEKFQELLVRANTGLGAEKAALH